VVFQAQTRSRFHPLAVVALCVLMVAGCTAAKVPFEYTPAYVPEDGLPPPWNHAVVSVVDQRGDLSVDEALTTAVDDAVGEALVAELRTAGLVSDASYGTYPAGTSSAELQKQGVDAHLVASTRSCAGKSSTTPVCRPPRSPSACSPA
jgi:hypothetical protein